jgi:hypothetical protein
MPLTRDELTEYIQARLTAAAAADPKLFTRDAEERIFEISTGIPRLVNIVCDNALVIGYALGKKRIGADVVNEAAADLLTQEPREAAGELPEAPASVTVVASPPRTRRWSQVGVIAFVVVALVIGLLSVGRSLLLYRDTAMPERVAVGRPPREVVQPGLRPEIEPRAPRLTANEPMGGASAGAGREPAAAPAAQAPIAAVEAPAVRPETEPHAAPPAVEAAADGPSGGAAAPAAPQAESNPQPAAPAAPVAAAPPVPAAPIVVGAAPAPVAPPPAAGPGLSAAPPAPAAPGVGSVASNSPLLAPAGVPMVPPVAKLPEAAPETADDLRLVLPDYRRIMVKPGDSVSQIATSTYGQASATMLDLVKMANPSIRDIDIIPIGQELRLPQLDQGLAVLQEPDGQYALLVLSTPLENRAREIGKALRKHGFEARVGRADFGAGRTVWRVIIGDLPDRSAAQTVGRQLQRVVREDTRIAAMAERLESTER